MKQLYASILHTFKAGLLGLVLLCGAVAVSSFAEPQKAAVSAKVLRLYPNPAVSFVNFEFAADVDRSHKLQIYSFMGRRMTELSIDGPRLQVTLNDDYFRGLYVFHLRNKEGKIVETGKFQVVR